MWIDSLKEMINDMSEEELRDAYLNMLIEHGEMAELFGLDEEGRNVRGRILLK